MKTQQLTILMLLAGILISIIPLTAQDTIECEDGFRLFTHELLWEGTPHGVCIPENPERIAYSWVFHVPALLRADVPLVGIGRHGYLMQEFPDWAEQIEAVPEIGLPPNLESTLAVNPDVIIEPSWAAEDNYAEISAIAPTVVFQFDGTHQWKQLAEMYFDIAGQLDAYHTLMAEYESRIDELSSLIGNPSETEMSIIWVTADGINFDTDYSASGILLADIGFDRPIAQILQQTPEEIIAAGGYPFYTSLSWEKAQDADGDFIIAYGDFLSDKGETVLDDLKSNPLWGSLAAVESGNVYYTSLNWAGGDIAGSHALLDDLAKAFDVYDQLSLNPYIAKSPIPEVKAENVTFPVTLTHSLGTIVISSQPERIVALSIADSDMAYAFGFTPLTIYENPFAEDGLWPWLADMYDAEQTDLLPLNDISFEYILELNPDIILGGGHYNIADLYSSLSDIAPTTAWQTESFNDTWQEQTLFAGQALGMEDKAHQLIAETESKIAAVSENYPELVGKTFSLSYLYEPSALSTIYREQDFAVQFFTELGFELTPVLAELAAQEGGFQGTLSLERLDMIEADLVMLAFGSPEIQEAYESNPLYQQLPAVQEGRVVVVDLSTVSQLRSPTVLGIRWVLEQLQPAFVPLAES